MRKGFSILLLAMAAVSAGAANDDKLAAMGLETDWAVVMNTTAMIGRDESGNAAEHYVKAFETYKPEPAEIFKLRMWQSWPGEIEAGQRTALESWVNANSAALAELKQGAEMPYFWLKYPEKEPLGKGPLSMYRQMSSLANAICWRAKLKASNGDWDGAFNDVMAAYKFGGHLTDRPHRLWEQRTGYDIQTTAVWTADMILSRSRPEMSAVAQFQNELLAAVKGQKFQYDLMGERIVVNEAIDMTFEGNNVAETSVESFKRNLGLSEAEVTAWKELEMAPTISQSRRLFWWLEGLTSKSPWQIRFEKIDLAGEIDSRTNSNVLLKYFRPDIVKEYGLPMQCRAETEAVAAICAIKRYQANKGEVPPTLKVLEVSGYMPYVPSDPYSGGPLTYVAAQNTFKLYSFGADFKNDGARMSEWGEGPAGGDQVFWPIHD